MTNIKLWFTLIANILFFSACTPVEEKAFWEGVKGGIILQLYPEIIANNNEVRRHLDSTDYASMQWNFIFPSLSGKWTNPKTHIWYQMTITEKTPNCVKYNITAHINWQEKFLMDKACFSNGNWNFHLLSPDDI